MNTGNQLGMDKDTQCDVSKERLDLLSKLLDFGHNWRADFQLLAATDVASTTSIADGYKVLRLSQSDLDGLIQHRGLTWRSIARYVSSQAILAIVIVSISLMSQLKQTFPSSYVVSFDRTHLWIVKEELRQVDDSYHHKATLQTLTKLYASYASKDTASLQRQTEYIWLLQECDIQLGWVNLGGNCAIDDPEFVKWVVENDIALRFFPAKFSKQVRRVFYKTITSAASKVMILALPLDQAPSSRLVDTIQKAATVKTLEIEIYGSGQELEPFLNESFKNDHIRNLKVTGVMTRSGWLDNLFAIIKSNQFVWIMYCVDIKPEDESDDESDDEEMKVPFYSDEKEQIVNLIRQATSLTDFYFYPYGGLGADFRKYELDPIFKERRYQQRALDIAPTLESNNECAGLLGRLICHKYVRLHADVLYDILRVNTAPLRTLWDGGRDNRIALLKQSMERSARELEAARASKRQQLAHMAL